MAKDKTTGRFTVVLANKRAEPYGNFHCGEPLQIHYRGTWHNTRFERNSRDGWYLVGLEQLKERQIEGLQCRVGFGGYDRLAESRGIAP